MPAGLAGPPCPELGGPIFDAYQEVAQWRRWSMGGPQPLAWADVAAWAQLRGVALDALELDGFLALERAWFRARNGGG